MLVVGLGNPGDEYRDTRHNVGFLLADRLASRFRTAFPASQRCRALVAPFTFKGQAHLLAKPQTYMNLSGEAVAPLLAAEGWTAADLLVVSDDVALPLGRLRLRPSGSCGGHNGLLSIEQALGTQAYWRLRLGVGAAPGPGRLVDHVLGPFAAADRDLLAAVLDAALAAVPMVLAGFGGKAMAKLNGLDLAAPPPEPPAPPAAGGPPSQGPAAGS